MAKKSSIEKNNRRAKLYSLRGRIGKAARVAERRWGIDEELISAPAAAEDAEGVTQVDEDEELQADEAQAEEPQAEEPQAAAEEPEAEESQAEESEESDAEAESDPEDKSS